MGQLLACADTNAATDNIVEGLVRAGLSVVRLGQAAKVCSAVDAMNIISLVCALMDASAACSAALHPQVHARSVLLKPPVQSTLAHTHAHAHAQLPTPRGLTCKR